MADIDLWATDMFKFYAPHVHGWYADTLQKLQQRYPDIQGVLPDLPFCSHTANTGDQVQTPDHVDCMNEKAGFCIIGIFGKFDCSVHGLLRFPELKILMELAHGDVVFIPSALLTHGNTEVCGDAIRRSLTFYTAGAISRFVDSGFMTEKKMQEKGMDAEIAALKAHYGELLQQRLGLHLTVEQWQEYHRQRV